MEIILKNTKRQYLETFSLLDFDDIHETFKRFSFIKEPLEAKIFAVNESISSHQLSKLKNHFENINTCSIGIYSNNRNTILSGKSLKIDSNYIKEQDIKNKLLSFNSMEIVLKVTKSKYFEIFSLLDLDTIHETFKRFSSIKEPLEAKIFAVNESISSHQLSKLKNHFDKINICSL